MRMESRLNVILLAKLQVLQSFLSSLLVGVTTPQSATHPFIHLRNLLSIPRSLHILKILSWKSSTLLSVDDLAWQSSTILDLAPDLGRL